MLISKRKPHHYSFYVPWCIHHGECVLWDCPPLILKNSCSVSLFPQLNCSFNSFLPFFFLLSHSVSLLLTLLRRNNSVCSYWNEVQLLSAWANFVLMYKAFHEIFTSLINMKYSSIINVPFHLNFVICHAKTSETIR